MINKKYKVNLNLLREYSKLYGWSVKFDEFEYVTLLLNLKIIILLHMIR
jgi:hypothetical protein